MKLSIANKILLMASYGFVLLGLICLWAGFWWIQHAAGYLGLHLILFLLAGALPTIGLLNARRTLRGQSQHGASKSSADKHDA